MTPGESWSHSTADIVPIANWSGDMDFAEVARQTGYRIYTTEFDNVRDIRSEVGAELLGHLRDQVECYLLPISRPR